jgi:uncharacterized membrane protein YtjA (UPF0391 family)
MGCSIAGVGTCSPIIGFKSQRWRCCKSEGAKMLHYAFLFLIIAFVTSLLGFGGFAGVTADIAKLLFAIFIALFCVALLLGYAVI